MQKIKRPNSILKILALSVLCLALLMPNAVQAIMSDGKSVEFIPSSRNLGIGIRNPVEKLHVNGNVFINGYIKIQDGSQQNGYILMSDANGKGTWTDSTAISVSSEWTDTGSLLHPADMSGAETIVIGDNTIGSADTILYENGKAIFNTQANETSFRVDGGATSNLLFADGSNDMVGIGTGTPSALLDVGGGTATYIDGLDDLLVKDDVYVNGTVFANAFNGDFYGNGRNLTNVLGATPSGDNGYVQFYKDGALGSNADLFWENQNGRLGLANLVPDTIIDINGAVTMREVLSAEPSGPDSNASVLWLSSGVGNGDPGDLMAKVTENGTTNIFTLIDFDGDADNPSYTSLTVSSLTADRLVRTNASGNLTSVSSLYVDDANGEVAVGHFDPQSTLDVNGKLTTTSFRLSTSPTNNFILQSDVNGDASWVNGDTIFAGSAAGSDTEIQFNNGGNFDASANLTWDGTYIYSSRFNAGLGSAAAPSYSFTGDTDTGLFATGTDQIAFSVGGSEKMRLDANGSLGINTLDPGANLDINGNVALSISAATNITAGVGITATKTIVKIQGNAAPINQITANPQIADGADGQLLVLKGNNDTNYVNFVDGNGLSMMDALPFRLGNKDTIVFIYDLSDDEWIEIMRSNK